MSSYMMTRDEQLDFSTARPPITMFIGNHYMERGTECGTFLETASPDGGRRGLGRILALMLVVGRLLYVS